MNLESKEHLAELESQWKAGWGSHPASLNVEALYLTCPSDQQMEERCPYGCNLETHGGNPWSAMTNYSDGYRQTRICRGHGYARIYVTSGLHAANANYSLAQKLSSSRNA
jgi:hypothetical protein